MSLIKLLTENNKEFSLPATVKDIWDNGLIFVKIDLGKLALPTKVEDNDSYGESKEFCIGKHTLNLEDKVEIEISKLPLLIRKKKFGGYEQPNAYFITKISTNDYEQARSDYITLFNALDDQELNNTTISNESFHQKIEHINNIYESLAIWLNVSQPIFNTFIDKLQNGNARSIIKAYNDEKQLVTQHLNAIQEVKKQADEIQEKLTQDIKEIDNSIQKIENNQRQAENSLQHIKQIELNLTSLIAQHNAPILRTTPDIVTTQLTPREEWNNKKFLNALHYPQSPLVEKAFQLALVSSLIRGRLILLEGSVGVGKTHLAENFAKKLGGVCCTIPVRPSWTDSSDLFGFFDPLAKVFRPTHFTEALQQAKGTNCIYPVILDEMNLARIENYGADLLSRIEKIHEKKLSLSEKNEENKLNIWSNYEYEALKKEKESLEQINSKTPEHERRLAELAFLNDYKPNMDLPNGFLLIGTLNADESTVDISPKVIDRSFVITFPHFSQISQQTADIYHFDVNEFRKNFIKVNPQNNTWEQFKEELKDFAQIGIPLSHRVYQDYLDMQIFLELMGEKEKNEGEYMAAFIWSRIIPRISFLKKEKQKEQQETLLKNIFTLLDKKDAKNNNSWKEIEAKLNEQYDNDYCSIVRFFGR